MPKLQCMNCFEWYDEEQIAYSHWLPEENHLETECKRCVEGTHIGFSFLPSDEYWEMRENDKRK